MSDDNDEPNMADLENALETIVKFCQETRRRLIMVERNVASLDGWRDSEWQRQKGEGL